MNRRPPGASPGSIRPLLVLAAVAIALLAGARARAQPPGQPRRDPAITDVQIGWQGAIIPERWTPIRVSISGGDRGFSGLLVAEFNQDASQAARIITPAAATPGLTTPIDLAAALPGLTSRIQFSLLSDSGLEVQRIVYDQIPGPGELQLNFNPLFDEGLLLALGPLSVTSAIDVVSAGATRPPAQAVIIAPGVDPPVSPKKTIEQNWESLRLARAEPGTLPFLWTAYDGLQAIIIRTESFAESDIRAIDAVRAWVASGGRLILIADAPGSRWRRWLPDGPGGELVDLSDVKPAALPRALADTLPDEAGPAASSAQARGLSLTARAVAEGWTAEWGIEGESGRFLVASGPVGFGRVMIIGLEPQSCLAGVTKPGLTAVWRDLLGDFLAEWIARGPDSESEFAVYAGAPSGPTPRARLALSDLLQRLTDVAPLGPGVVIGILAGMLLLTLLVGPVDALALRRLRLRQHSWLTALGWISLMSIIAYVLPPLIRTGPDVIHRLTVQDIVADPDAAPGAGQGWSAGLTGVFASQAGPVDLAPFEPGRWWRGVSAAFGSAEGRRLLPPLPARIDTGGPGGQAIRGAVPAGLTQSQWTLRCLADDGPARADLSARARRDGDDWSVTLIGVPPSARLAQARFEIAGHSSPVRWSSVSNPATTAGLRTWRGRTGDKTEGKHAPGPDLEQPLPPGDERPVVIETGAMMAPGGARAFTPVRSPSVPPEAIDPDSACGLPGPADRTPSLRARLDSGRWGLLTLVAAGLPPAFPGEPEARQSVTTVYRIMIPLADGPGPEDAE